MTELPDPPMPTVDAIWRAREAEAEKRPRHDGYGINASALGAECDRKLWYGLRWASPPETLTGRKLRIFERGDIEERRVIDDLRRAGLFVMDHDPQTGRQWAFALADGLLRGKADGICEGVIEAPKAQHVLEVKSLKAADWRAILKHGLAKAKPEHWHQLHAGMAGLGVARGLYVGVNKDTEEILTERIRIDPDTGARQEERVMRIAAADDPPPRISDKADSFACRFCDHRALCHGGQPARRHCRTCLHFTFGRDGNGHCARFNEPRKPEGQRKVGEECPVHLYLPGLVAGEQIDSDPDAETITYQLADGTLWIDGAEEALVK
jgi:hypothetical protein